MSRPLDRKTPKVTMLKQYPNWKNIVIMIVLWLLFILPLLLSSPLNPMTLIHGG